MSGYTPAVPALSARLALRSLAVFLVAFLGLCALAGTERLSKPSTDNHYSHLAQSWLDGRLDHGGKPKGWCTPELRRAKKCKRHTYDDWARVWTLGLHDGTSVRGYPCKTSACLDLRRRGVEGWLILGQERTLREFERGEIVSRTETWYVSFPPGPALIMLPAVALLGPERTPDVLITCLLAALIPLVMLRLYERERPARTSGESGAHLWAVAAWTFASPAAFLGANGRVWFTAQVAGALCLAIYVSMGWRCHRPTLAGLALALAVSCRPHMAVAVLFFFAEWWRESKLDPAKRWSIALRFAAPLLVVGALLMAHNWVRFEDPFEFGHRFLEIRWQQRMQEIGMFSTTYLGRNLQCALALLPVWDHGPGPWPGALIGQGPSAAWIPRVSVHGSSILFGAPWLLLLGAARRGFPQRWGLIFSAVAVALPSLLYQNSGQLQFSYRFAVDWLPLLLPVLVFGGGTDGGRTSEAVEDTEAGTSLRRRAANWRRWLFPALVLAGMAWQLHGAWWFGRQPGQLFVTDPRSWPFEAELEGP